MIRFAEERDIPYILQLLEQVNYIHYQGRPDIFKLGTKYKVEELKEMIKNTKNPIFVYEESSTIYGYAFCITKQHLNDNLLTDIKTLYIDDLCVDFKQRGKGIGTKIYQYVKEYAKENSYYNVTLNVWELNENAQSFYEHLGLKPLKTYMEEIL